MSELPFDAKVSCTDGRGGTSVAVTLKPANRVVTHLVVEDSSGNQRLVPLGKVSKTNHDEIWLNCTEDELGEMPLFLVTEFVERAPQDTGEFEEDEWEDGVDLSAYAMTTEAYGMPVEVERVPPGEIAFHRSTEIEATDGHVGKVEKLLIEPDSGQITHLVMHKGHLWGKKDVWIPLSAVGSVDYDAVYLNVEKSAVSEFPTDR